MPQDLRRRAPSGHATASLQIQPACQCAVACARCEQRPAQDRTSMKPACVSPFGCRHRSLNARAAWRKTHPPEDVCESHQGQATSNFRAVARVRRQRPPAGTYLLQDGGISAYHASGVGREASHSHFSLCRYADFMYISLLLHRFDQGCWKSEPCTHCMYMGLTGYVYVSPGKIACKGSRKLLHFKRAALKIHVIAAEHLGSKTI